MFLNIVYYDLSTDEQMNNATRNSVTVGALYISGQQVRSGHFVSHSDHVYSDSAKVVIGLIVEVLGFGPSLLIARGIEFGDLKSQKCLTSILSGFFSSLLLTQRLKIVTDISLSLPATCSAWLLDRSWRLTNIGHG